MMSVRPIQRILESIKQAIAFVEGDKSKAKVTRFIVKDGKVTKVEVD